MDDGHDNGLKEEVAFFEGITRKVKSGRRVSSGSRESLSHAHRSAGYLGH